MLSLEYIKSESQKAARKAAREKKLPYIIEAEDMPFDKFSAFPYLGTYIPKGWKKITDHFVDSSGFGSDSEPAMSIKQFQSKLVVGHGYAVTEAGQFQVYVGEYVKQG